jgi:hypothetical protein
LELLELLLELLLLLKLEPAAPTLGSTSAMVSRISDSLMTGGTVERWLALRSVTESVSFSSATTTVILPLQP